MTSTVNKVQRAYRVRFQAEAIDELDRIYQFIYADSLARTRRFMAALKKQILDLKHLPQRGTRARLLETPASDTEIRFIEYKGYLIFYTIDKTDVVVLHCAGPGQDWLLLLGL